MSRRTVAAWAREPLLHFLLLGALLFAVDAWWSGRAGGEQRIVVSEARVRTLAQNFARTWQRAPSAAEFDALIEDFIRDEILVREAQRLGLERDDTVIRKRLRQKLEIITEEAADQAPSEAQLATYLAAHPDAFRAEARIAFEQVYFDAHRRGARLEGDIAAALARLNGANDAGAANRRPASFACGVPACDRAAQPARSSAPRNPGLAADFARLGDALFVLQPSYPLSAQRVLAANFGNEFAQALAAIPAEQHGRWVGPIESGYGLHLVRLTGFAPGAVPTLDEVRPLVEREWRNARRLAAREEHYQALRRGYDIVVKRPESAK